MVGLMKEQGQPLHKPESELAPKFCTLAGDSYLGLQVGKKERERFGDLLTQMPKSLQGKLTVREEGQDGKTSVRPQAGWGSLSSGASSLRGVPSTAPRPSSSPGARRVK